MTPDPIEQLLQEADEAQPSAGSSKPAELARRVIERSQRRLAARRIAGSVVMLALLIGGGWVVMIRERPVEVVKVVPAATAVPTELASLRRQISQQEALVERLLAAEQRDRTESHLLRIDLPTRSDPCERAAAVVVDQADRLYKSSGQSGPVLKAYEQVIQTFPNTFSADLARERVAALRKEG